MPALMMRLSGALLCVLLVMPACAARVRPAPRTSSPPAPAMSQLLPLPASVETTTAPPFVITPATIIEVPPGDERLRAIGRLLSGHIGLSAGADPPRVETTAAAGGPRIRLEVGDAARPGDEAYDLTVAPEGVTIRGRTAAGVFYGVQTLRQLLPPTLEHQAIRADASRPVQAAAVRIADAPRFGWRGAMLDVARHFLTVDEVKRYIDLMALHKLNRLHLHLSDDQGWRIEIRSRPRLASEGGSTEVGGGPGGYYSQAQYSDIVSYAGERFITIVPEIDMPGHTNAALASYAELNCDGVARKPFTGIEVGFSAVCVEKEETYRFIDDVVREIAGLTPGNWFHAGGDEVKTLTAAQYTRFIERVQQIVRSHGKQMIGWDEIAPAALAPGTIVQHWRPGTTPTEAVSKGAKIILSPADRVYLDMKYDRSTPIGLAWAALIEVRDAYDWDPATIAPGVPESAFLGVEAPLWTETVANIRDAEFLAFPRLAAVAEVAWTPRERRGWDDFRVRLGAQAPRWTALGINFCRSPQVPWQR